MTLGDGQEASATMGRGNMIGGRLDFDAIHSPGQGRNGEAEKNANQCKNQQQFRETKATSHCP